MGITVNLVTYLVGTMHLPSSTSSKIVSNFAGTTLLLCLLGGIIADSFLGKYWTIVVFYLIDALGVGALAISTGLPQLRLAPCNTSLPNKCEQANAFQMGVFYTALYATALGIGGIKSSVSGFGSEQFDDKDEKEKSQKTYFFNRIYSFINIGTLLAVTVLVFQKCLGSLIIHILKNVVAAVRKRNLKLPPSADLLFEDTPVGSRIRRTAQYRCLDKAAILVEEDHNTNESSSTTSPWRLFSDKNRGNKNVTIATLSISAFLLLPQFIIVGNGEGFMYSGQLNFFITQSPKGMKAMSTGLFQTTISFGYLASSLLITLVKRVTGGGDGHGWLTDHINNWRLDMFYALLAILSLINFGAYLLCASWYKPSTSEVDIALNEVVVVTGATGSDQNKE
ncbi:hypothetical protein Sjap_019235 [Stephania japonica]|uniref:Uncharacterized protein n=1 Tax=Stephania japonica TaxID=461633 RepID=A0AAP0EZN9_9MAGN